MKSVELPPEVDRHAAIKALIDQGVEPSPENLLKASAKRGSPLYDYFRSMSDKQWANFGRYKAAAKIIHRTKVEISGGSKTISVRMVECIRVNGEHRYAPIQNILSDRKLTDAYMAEIAALMRQSADKMDRLRALMAD